MVTFYATLNAALILSSPADPPTRMKYSYGAMYVVLAICCAIVSSSTSNTNSNASSRTSRPRPRRDNKKDAGAGAGDDEEQGGSTRITTDPKLQYISPLIKDNTHT